MINCGLWLLRALISRGDVGAVMEVRGRVLVLLIGMVCGGGFDPSAAHAVAFTLRRSAILTSQPSYESRYRLELDPREILVGAPALEQQGDFCRYRLFDRRRQPLTPEVAWTPCHSIDKLFVSP